MDKNRTLSFDRICRIEELLIELSNATYLIGALETALSADTDELRPEAIRGSLIAIMEYINRLHDDMASLLDDSPICT